MYLGTPECQAEGLGHRFFSQVEALIPFNPDFPVANLIAASIGHDDQNQDRTHGIGAGGPAIDVEKDDLDGRQFHLRGNEEDDGADRRHRPHEEKGHIREEGRLGQRKDHPLEGRDRPRARD